MKFCQTHWDQLKQAVKAKGLFDLVSTDGKEVMQKVVGELEGAKPTLENFDPLLAANNLIWANAIKCGGLYLLGRDEKGNEYCPVCEADKHGFPGWIEKAVEGVAEGAKNLPRS
jgi:hypothetical protein